MKTAVVLGVILAASAAHADPPTAVITATPSTLGGGESSQLAATVTPGTAPASTGLVVSCDLSLIGDPLSMLFDDGASGDGAAGDLVFGLLSIVGDGVPYGPRDMPCTVSDDQARSTGFTLMITVVPICGDGMVSSGETCDDFGTESDDGCADVCLREPGWVCVGEPSDCGEVCGDGLVVGVEGCDDDSHSSGDGCAIDCQTEPGWACTGEPSACEHAALCGDGVIDAGEECDDLDPAGDDGCDATCVVESGYTCDGEPSRCVDEDGVAPHDLDGDGVLDALDLCPDVADDQADADGDGVGDACQELEPGGDGCCSTGGGDAPGALVLAVVLALAGKPRRRK